MNNNKIYYVCKYTPIELLAAMGASCENLNGMPGNFELAEQMVHPNICGFGKAVLEAVMEGQVKELVLVNCCDTIRSVYDVLEDMGKLDFLYVVDMLRGKAAAARERTALQLKAWQRHMQTIKDRIICRCFAGKHLQRHLYRR